MEKRVSATFSRENRNVIGEFLAAQRPAKTANIAANPHLSASVIAALEARQAHYQQRQARCVVFECNVDALNLFLIVRQQHLFRVGAMGGLQGIWWAEFNACLLIPHPLEQQLVAEMADIAIAYINAVNTKDS